MRTVAALFVRAESVYKLMPGVDAWDAERNATLYDGPHAVVAHPPCRTWGNLRTVATRAPANEHEYGPWALEQVRRCGGVLEHPKGSTLFKHCDCGTFTTPDKWGGGR